MTAPLGSKLAQLANARKKSEETLVVSAEELARREAEAIAGKARAIQQLLTPHVDAFNEAVEAVDRITVEVASPVVKIKQNHVNLISIEVKVAGATFKRTGGRYTSEDYFTFGTDESGAITFRNFDATVKKPLSGDQYAEIVLMEALGLNE